MWTQLSDAELIGSMRSLWLDPAGVVHDDVWCASPGGPSDALLLPLIPEEEAERRGLPACSWCFR
jgi:hypothetical protein